ncbi:hypothetical protein [Paenibacillus lutrae]|uniref:Uncharacterized protein n=1 Tax=Paenibacillus lutrae TaxID=2078573 RepID=A0A7X3K154_9BACL|nr:hypothetical protein [Paenibacillus lutrae]MVP01792.1 hypothetical protein [Paenibacillus lutrae]
MLSFDQKIAILESFPELQRKNVSLGRVNFHYEESAHDKKTVAYHIHPNGNGYIYAALIPDCPADDKGMVNIRDYSEEQLRSLVEQSIRSLSGNSAAAPIESGTAPSAAANEPKNEQLWQGPDNQTLTLRMEDDLWFVYAGLNLDSVFESLEEAEEYLNEEGFAPAL